MEEKEGIPILHVVDPPFGVPSVWPQIKLEVCTMNRQKIILFVESRDTVEDLKIQLRDQESIPIEQQLMWHGKELKAKDKTALFSLTPPINRNEVNEDGEITRPAAVLHLKSRVDGGRR